MVAGVTLLSLFSYGVLSLGSFGLLCVCLFFVYVDGRVLDLTGLGFSCQMQCLLTENLLPDRPCASRGAWG